ncbi:hypothetical protein Tco_0158089 [Tanacetum coccineum]
MAEEEALSEQQKKRKAQVQFKAQYYTEEDWDAIRAKLEANAELTKDLQRKIEKCEYGESSDKNHKEDKRLIIKDVPTIGEKVVEVKEEELVKEQEKERKQNAMEGSVRHRISENRWTAHVARRDLLWRRPLFRLPPSPDYVRGQSTTFTGYVPYVSRAVYRVYANRKDDVFPAEEAATAAAVSLYLDFLGLPCRLRSEEMREDPCLSATEETMR